MVPMKSKNTIRLLSQRAVLYKYPKGSKVHYIGTSVELSGREGIVLKCQHNNPVNSKFERSYRVQFDNVVRWVKEGDLDYTHTEE